MQPRRTRQVQIPLIDAGRLNAGGKLRQDLRDLGALVLAGLARHRHHQRLRTQPQRRRRRHRRPHPKPPRLIRGRAHHPTPVPRAAHDQQRVAPGPLGVAHPSHRHKKRIGICEQYLSGHPVPALPISTSAIPLLMSPLQLFSGTPRGCSEVKTSPPYQPWALFWGQIFTLQPTLSLVSG